MDTETQPSSDGNEGKEVFDLAADIDPNAELLRRVEAFLLEQGMKPTRLGILVMNDGALVSQLREGRNLSMAGGKKLLDFMASYRPDGEEAAAA